jgi:hypothetical protein
MIIPLRSDPNPSKPISGSGEAVCGRAPFLPVFALAFWPVFALGLALAFGFAFWSVAAVPVCGVALCGVLCAAVSWSGSDGPDGGCDDELGGFDVLLGG